jgi:hypothetical protein
VTRLQIYSTDPDLAGFTETAPQSAGSGTAAVAVSVGVRGSCKGGRVGRSCEKGSSSSVYKKRKEVMMDS